MSHSVAPDASLRTAIERHVVLPEAVWQDVRSRWRETVSCRKDEYLTKAGEVEKYFYLVLEGVQRLYYLTPEGNEVVLGFTFTGNFSGVHDSFVQQTPAQCYLQALSDTKLLGIRRKDLEALYDRHPVIERWGRLFIQDILFGRVQREVELTTHSAEERYRDFIRRSPVPLQQVAQKHLASYLNMTPETFSRQRANHVS